MELLQEITNTRRRDVRVDREAGVLFGVKIIGCASRNGREYPNDTLREAIPLYENSKVNLDHPDGDPRRPRSYQDRFGIIRNVELRENEGLYADFRFNPKHQIAEQLLWDAEHAPDNVGFSHNVEAVVRRENDKTIVEKIVAVRSVDLVADPATTAGLFESEQSVTENVTVTELQTLREQILDELRNIVPELKRLIEDRRPQPITESKPVSREQFVPEKEIDAKTFAKLITR
jgi:hypothetical protein